MTYQLERSAIETYMASIWGGAIGYDGHEFTPSSGSIRLTINSGAVLQGSIGRVSNVKWHVGTLIVSIFTEGGLGSAAERGHIQTILAGLTEKRLTSAGIIATSGEPFLRFSPPQLSPAEHPYVSGTVVDAPFRITNITAPFVRYSIG